MSVQSQQEMHPMRPQARAVLALAVAALSFSATARAQTGAGCTGTGAGGSSTAGTTAGAASAGAFGAATPAMQQLAGQLFVQSRLQAMAAQQQQLQQQQLAKRLQALARYRNSLRSQRATGRASSDEASVLATSTQDDRWSHLRERATERRRELDEPIARRQEALAARRARTS